MGVGGGGGAKLYRYALNTGSSVKHDNNKN